MKALDRNRMVRLIECMNRHSDVCQRMRVVDESTFRGKRIKEEKKLIQKEDSSLT